MPCTAKGCLYIIQKYCPSVIGKRVVVVGQLVLLQLIGEGSLSFAEPRCNSDVMQCDDKEPFNNHKGSRHFNNLYWEPFVHSR